MQKGREREKRRRRKIVFSSLRRRRYECKFNFSFRAKEATSMKTGGGGGGSTRRGEGRPRKGGRKKRGTPFLRSDKRSLRKRQPRLLSFELLRCTLRATPAASFSLGKIYEFEFLASDLSALIAVRSSSVAFLPVVIDRKRGVLGGCSAKNYYATGRDFEGFFDAKKECTVRKVAVARNGRREDWIRRLENAKWRKGRGRTSREKNVLEESNCEGRRRRSVLGNRNKFLHGVREYCFRAGEGRETMVGCKANCSTLLHPQRRKTE